jgi:HlyD family secretion protein
LASVRRAKTALEFAQRDAARQRELTKSGAASAIAVERAELEERTLHEALGSAEFGTRVAEHELAMAQAALGRLGKARPGEDEQMELTSPVKGRVLRVIHESEGAVQPGTPLLELGDPAALEIVSDVLTSDAVHVAQGANATIERWGGAPLRGHVRLVEPSAFTAVSALGVEEQRVNVVIDLAAPQADWAALGDGYRVEVRIAVWEGQDVMSVPAGALFRSGREWAVYRVADGRAQLTTIEIGRRNADRVEVVKGLAAGDAVVVYPSDRIEHGVQVEAR